MVSVTGTVTEPTLEEIFTDAVYVPTARVPGLTDTPMELGVVPLDLLTESQDAPDVASVNLRVRLLVTDKDCDAGKVPPCR